MKLKKVAIGIAIFILTIIFIVFANKAINAEPKYTDCYSSSSNSNSYSSSYNYNESVYKTCQSDYQDKLTKYEERSFITILIMSILVMFAGVLVRKVAPISWGLVMSGLVMIIYVFSANFEAIGKPYRAIASGLALVVLIWLAYAKLGDKEKISGDKPKTPDPELTMPPSTMPPTNINTPQPPMPS